MRTVLCLIAFLSVLLLAGCYGPEYGYGVGGELPPSTWVNTPYYQDGPAYGRGGPHTGYGPYYSDGGYGDY